LNALLLCLWWWWVEEPLGKSFSGNLKPGSYRELGGQWPGSGVVSLAFSFTPVFIPTLAGGLLPASTLPAGIGTLPCSQLSGDFLDIHC